jgi:predicted regulator of Ras-like GTPase activity (Roadblock/LC7/MglB family)
LAASPTEQDLSAEIDRAIGMNLDPGADETVDRTTGLPGTSPAADEGLSEEDLRSLSAPDLGEVEAPTETVLGDAWHDPAFDELFDTPLEGPADRAWTPEPVDLPAQSLTSWLHESAPVAAAPPAPPVAEPIDLAALRASIARLGVDRSLFDRGRNGKRQLIESGRIGGASLLPGVEPPGPSIDELWEQVTRNPDDAEVRLRLADALSVGEPERALEEYRQVFRRRAADPQPLIASVSRLADSGANVSIGAHRLLGAVFHRTGNYHLAASHYQSSLEAYLRAAGVGAGAVTEEREAMGAALHDLLDYQDVIAAVASTRDGLVVASAGLPDDDAESVAAAGTSLASAAEQREDSALAIDLDGGSVFLALGQEVLLLVLAEPDVAAEALATVMVERVGHLDAELAGGVAG